MNDFARMRLAFGVIIAFVLFVVGCLDLAGGHLAIGWFTVSYAPLFAAWLLWNRRQDKRKAATR